MKVQADKYFALKAKHGEMDKKYGFSMPFDAKPVDLNGGYVAFNTSQEDKEGKENLDLTSQCNLERFGLTTDGV